MEKQLSVVGYWLGLICTAPRVDLSDAHSSQDASSPLGVPGGTAISYMSFLHGAALFFLLTIASWCRTAKS